MRKLYGFLFFLFMFTSAGAQYAQNFYVNETQYPPLPSSRPNEFVLTQEENYNRGSVFNTTRIDLSQNFIVDADLYFGRYDERADGMAFVLQNIGTDFLGNRGAGIGYHHDNFTPSFVVEFDNYYNAFTSDIPEDHVGFMSNSNAFHDASQPPIAVNGNVEDDQWHRIRFSWMAATKTLTVELAVTPTYTQTFTYTGDVVTNIFGGNNFVYWGFTASTGDFPNEQRVRINSILTGTPITISGNVTNATCTGGAIDISVSGGMGTYSYAWSNGATTEDVANLAPGNYTVTVTDEAGSSKQASFTVGNNGCVTPITITGTVTNAACNSGGAIDIAVSGGGGAYTYAWSNGSTNQDLTNIGPGSYTVTVTSGSGATKQASFNVVNGNDATPPQLTTPGTQTLCQNLLPLYNIPQLGATDNCSVASVSFTITGATSRSGTGKNASGIFNPGTSTITWKVKDAAGNTATATTQVVISKITVNIPDVYAVTPGGRANTLYKGYGPTALKLTAQASGGAGGYTYLWSTGATTASITVNPSVPGLYAYIVVVKDASGCNGLMLKWVIVDDIRCGTNKVEICHVPNGNKKKADEQCVSMSSVAAHLAHGDQLGACSSMGDNSYNSTTMELATEMQTAAAAPKATAYPNPTNGRFSLQVKAAETGKAQLVIVNVNGAVVERSTVQLTGKGQVLQLDLSKQPAGIYLVKIVSKEGEQTEKIVVRR